MASARRAAYDVLCEVEKGAYANLALKRRLPDVEESERAFCTALVYETLSKQLYLDWAIDRYARSVKPAVRVVLRLGAAQLLLLGLPPYAAVNESVRLLKSLGKGALSGFVNGVLRRIDRDRDSLVPPTAALRCGWPQWAAEQLARDYGSAAAEAIMTWCEKREDRPLPLRVNTLKASKEEVEAALKAEGLTVQESALCPDVLLLPDLSGDIAAHPLFLAGKVTVQSEGSALICRAAAPGRGGRVLDACAAPGGKTAALAALMKEGAVTAFELHPHRAALVQKTAARLVTGVTVTVRVQDASRYAPEYEGAFDAVLVDAPCSGLGVTRGKPDLKLKRTPEDIAALSKTQFAILKTCSRYVRPGGALVYSTCTLCKEENEGVIARFLAECPGFVSDAKGLRAALPAAFPEERTKDGMLQLFPHLDGVDGFFFCRMVRCASQAPAKGVDP